MPEDAAEARLQDRIAALDRGADEFVDGQAGGQREPEADEEQRDERLQLDLDDEEQQDRDREPAESQQSGVEF